MATKNTFFLKETYDNEIGLDINEDVLERIYSDGILPTYQLNVNFTFVTDTKFKAKEFARVLQSTFKDYTEIVVAPYGDLFDISGITSKMRMNLETINEWNKLMWDFGYNYDCKLDGWFVGA